MRRLRYSLPSHHPRSGVIDTIAFDILPSPEGRRDSWSHLQGFLFQRSLPERDKARPGLTASPQASNTVSPTACILRAALRSRSWTTPHSGHVHTRISSDKESSTCPQSKQRLEEGYHLSILTRVRPYHAALYSSCLTNSDQPTSLMALARQWFLTIFLTCRLSMQTTWFSRMV